MSREIMMVNSVRKTNDVIVTAHAILLLQLGFDTLRLFFLVICFGLLAVNGFYICEI